MATSSASPVVPEESSKRPAPSLAPVIVDLGKKRRKQVRDLRKGKGKLMEQVADILEDLRTSGTVGANAQPVVIVVRQKRRNRSILPGL